MARKISKRKPVKVIDSPPSDGNFGRIPRQTSLGAQVEQQIREAIAQGRFPGGRLPTDVELAEQLGVSRETVRLATQRLVAEGVLIKYRRRGTFLRAPDTMRLPSVSSTTIGYLQADYGRDDTMSDHVTRSFSGLMLQGVVEGADGAGFQVLVRRATPAKINAAFDDMVQRIRPKGLIFGSVAEEKLLRRALGADIPAVLLDHELNVAKISSIRSDSAGASDQAVHHLAELGHQRIAIAYWNLMDLNPWGLQGYRRALRDRRLTRRRKWEFFVELAESGAKDVVEALAPLSPRPTALICFNNTQAKLIIDALSRVGLHVPGDISVVACGGEEVAALTCVQPDWYAMGLQAAHVLISSISAVEPFPARAILLPHVLRMGSTTQICAE